MSANRRTLWGWHQLADQWASQLVHEAGIRPADLVLDIGAGTGALTAPLVAAGAHVIAFELHPRRAAHLRQRFPSSDEVKVVQADAQDLRLPRRPFRVVANPPFAITASVLRRLLGPGSRLLAADLVVPHHVALRWAQCRPPGANRWSATFDTRVARRLPRTAFHPPPPGDVAVLRVERRPPR